MEKKTSKNKLRDNMNGKGKKKCWRRKVNINKEWQKKVNIIQRGKMDTHAYKINFKQGNVDK